MKGIIFNLLEEVVTRFHGPDVWEDLLDAANVSGSYTSLGNYPDRELELLVRSASEALELPPSEVLRWFGRQAIPLLARRYPTFFDAHDATRSFALSVNGIIHPEVRKLYPGAGCPVFRFQEAEDGALLLGYDSPRKLCALSHGFLEGAADHFGEVALVEHVSCMLRDDPECLLKVGFVPHRLSDHVAVR